MPKINVYVPDDLAEAVKDRGIPVSSVCQRALEHAVRAVAAVAEAGARDLDGDDGAFRRPANLTERTRTALRLAVESARAAGAARVGTEHLLRGMLDEGSNLALLVLDALEIEPGRLTEALDAEPPGGPAGDDRPGRRFSPPAVAALERAVVEALSLGHNYVGCEHLLLGLVAEPEGAGGRVLRAAGADQRATRRAVTAALNGYVHLRAQVAASSPPPASGAAPAVAEAVAVAAAVERALEPVARRLERLEQRVDALAGGGA